ncbi:MAG: hypothetical protein JRN51_07035 [Nitrososphaerota archaeon]|nr:hypothetical protein [Nitrososphaerota archaeon]
MASVVRERRQELAFTVQTIDCITCSPFFRRSLKKVDGVLEVKELPITNKIVVVFDEARLERSILLQEIERISQRAGYGGKIIIRR